jgi:hypothetical protein
MTGGRFIGLAGLCGLLAAGAAWAAPVEAPAGDYAGRSYVDSAGCAFQRAVMNGTVLWAARVGADGAPVCGLAPTFAPEVAAVPVAAVPAVRAKAAPVVLAGRWLQVGAFADPANADRALARLGALGLPRATLAVNGGRLKAVLAGPFEGRAAFDAALGTLRQAGFGELLARP